MSYKVFLFENDQYLYCEKVKFKDGVYHGWVINGRWHLMYDTAINGWFACESWQHANSLVAVAKGKKKLIWACDPDIALFDYNTVIAEAQERYESGEPANYELTPPKPIETVYDEDDEEEISQALGFDVKVVKG